MLEFSLQLKSVIEVQRTLVKYFFLSRYKKIPQVFNFFQIAKIFFNKLMQDPILIERIKKSMAGHHTFHTLFITNFFISFTILIRSLGLSH